MLKLILSPVQFIKSLAEFYKILQAFPFDVKKKIILELTLL